MASYHRVLESFGRSVRDKTVECDCDIHPWEISIDGEQWAGKIRLIGFIDVFFLISYSANARFEDGIILYKDKGSFRAIAGNETDKWWPSKEKSQSTHDLPHAELDAEDSEDSESEDDLHPPEPANHKKKMVDANEAKDKPNDEEKSPDSNIKFYRSSSFEATATGHRIGLRATYPVSWLREYTIKIIKPCPGSLRKRITRALKPHSLPALMRGAVRCGIVSQGQLAGHVIDVLLAGSRLDDTAKKYVEGLKSGYGAGNQYLSNEKT